MMTIPSSGPAPRFLFLDPSIIVQSENVAIRVNPAERREIVLRRDRPWEAAMLNIFLTVREEHGKIRMWYGATAGVHDHAVLAYAESIDGIEWHKPNLGLVEFQGSKENNLLGIPAEGAVFIDANASEDERYAVITNVQQHGNGVVRFVSPDGIQWRRANDFLPFRADSQTVAFWDEQQGCYVLYTRGWDVRPGWNRRIRNVVRLTAASISAPHPVQPSGKGNNPTNPEDLPRIVDEFPIVLAADSQDPARTDVYNISALPYPLDERWHLGFPSFMLHAGEDIIEGLLEVHFTGSRDGIHWQRYDRTPYAAREPWDSDSGGMIYMGTGLVVRGGEIWQYGPAYKTNHGDKVNRRSQGDGAIYRYVQRVDGFVAIDFAQEGRCLTAPVEVQGNTLCLNVNSAHQGSLRVGLVDEFGRGIPGFETDQCDELRIDSTHTMVSWRGKHDLAPLRGSHIQLEFSGNRARLFSFYFAADESGSSAA